MAWSRSGGWWWSALASHQIVGSTAAVPLGSWSSTEATTAATITPAAVPHTMLTIADLIVALSAAQLSTARGT